MLSLKSISGCLITASLTLGLAVAAFPAPLQASATAKVAAPASAPAAPSAPEQAAAKEILLAVQSATTAPQSVDEQMVRFAQQFPQSSLLGGLDVYATLFFKRHDDYGRLLEYGEQALKADPNSLVMLLTLGEAIPAHVQPSDLDYQMRLAEAQRLNRHAIEVAEHLPATVNGVSLQPAQARQILRETQRAAHSSLGIIAMQQKDYATAVGEFTQAIAAESGLQQANDQLRLANAQIALRHFDLAIAALDNATKLAGANSSYTALIARERERIQTLNHPAQ